MQTQRLSLIEKVGFSLGDAASNIFFQSFILYITMFYTDVFRLPAESIALMFLITKIWDAVNDPMMGLIADRTNTRWGKFRPYVLWGAIPFGILGVLTFTTPNWGITARLIYAYITYTLLMMAYTVVNVPYSALMGVMTPNTHERTVLSSYRFFAAFFATLLVQSFMLELVKAIGKDNPAVGWQWAMTIFSSLAVILLFITFFTTQERVHPPKDQKTSIRHDIMDLLTNKPWLLIGAATIFQLIYICMRGGAIAYYFKYFVKDQQIAGLGTLSWQRLSSGFLVTGTITTIIGVLLTTRISKVFGKSTTYATLLGIAGIATACVYLLRPQDVVAMFVLQAIISFSVGPVSVLQWSIYTDAADYSEWVKGRRATALVMSASLFALKLGIALGAAALAWILGLYGYQPDQEQTARGLLGIRMVNSIYPAIFALIGSVFMFFYPINKATLQRMEAELIERRKKEGSDAVL
ncbi:MAG: MFS transporter [Sedimentisphaerales bacterium]|jgi:GPH family glycoside/pentoside/hexuronide:cation symporter|nr:MFS transporter [Sedimentisphaerales bacterium]